MSKNIKDGAYVINLDAYADVGAHWIVLHGSNNDATYIDSFGIEHVSKETKHFIRNKNMQTNIFRIQANNSITCGYFCIGFIDYMVADKTLTDCTGLFSPYDFFFKKMIKSF